MDSRRIAVLGAGANGASIGADLARAGEDVVLIDQWPENVENAADRSWFAVGSFHPSTDGCEDEVSILLQHSSTPARSKRLRTLGPRNG